MQGGRVGHRWRWGAVMLLRQDAGEAGLTHMRAGIGIGWPAGSSQQATLQRCAKPAPPTSTCTPPPLLTPPPPHTHHPSTNTATSGGPPPTWTLRARWRGGRRPGLR